MTGQFVFNKPLILLIRSQQKVLRWNLESSLKEHIFAKSTCICSSISLRWRSKKSVVSRQARVRTSDTSLRWLKTIPKLSKWSQNCFKVIPKWYQCCLNVVSKLRSMPCHGRWRSDHPILHAGGNLLDTCAPNCAPRWSAIWLCIFLCCCVMCWTIFCTNCCTMCCTVFVALCASSTVLNYMAQD